jgi:hypothetical protein
VVRALQFAGLSSTQIADDWSSKPKHQAGVDPSTILKGLKAAAKLTAWDCLRTAQGKPNRRIPHGPKA